MTKKFQNLVLGIDPGLEGAFVLTNRFRLQSWPMPVLKKDGRRIIDFQKVAELVGHIRDRTRGVPVFLEEAKPMAMGSKHAFNYGRGFEALTIALRLAHLDVTLVSPHVWAKVMHAGIGHDLRAKAKSAVAVKRHFPQLIDSLPRVPKGKYKGALLEGPMDALLIAGYGLRMLDPDKYAFY